MSARRKRVVVVTIEDGTEGEDYLTSLAAAGIGPEDLVVLHSADPLPSAFDALVLGGGEDIDPELYGEIRHEKLGDVNRPRDEQELSLVAQARRRGAPVFGICRGLQVINVAFGGTLWQDIPAECPSDVPHQVRRPKDHLAHDVHVRGESVLLFPGPKTISVNSRHHQAIASLGAGLRATAVSDDGLVEAIEAADGSPVFAVQWHPENLPAGPAGQDLFARFVKLLA